MDFRLSPEMEAFRQEVRQFIAENLTPEVKAGGQLAANPAARGFVKKMGRKGWLAISWPERYGGQGKSPLYLSVLNEELAYAGAPGVPVATAIVGPTLMAAASEELKEEILPQIARGDVLFCLGYTEPDAGSDLASLRSTAVLDGDDWVINGQKRFTTVAHVADYCFFIARTDPNAPKHRGLSLFVVDMKLPGITVKPLPTMEGGPPHTNETFWENVRVPRRYLVGEPNMAWRYMALALDFERFLPFPVSATRARFEDLLGWARSLGDGRQTTDDRGAPVVRRLSSVARHRLARLAIEVEVAQMINYNLAHAATKFPSPGVEAAMNKLYTCYLNQRLANAAVDLMGPYGQLRPGSPHAPLDGLFAIEYLSTVVDTIGGGTAEVQKNVIALRGLGLPR